jgi:retron-type reverse transcriptase
VDETANSKTAGKMKSYTNLFEDICAFENLYRASRKAEKGKRFRHEVAVFNQRRAENLLKIQELLRSGSYPFGKFHTFKIVQPKPRIISAAPYAERVVHHALINIIEPLFERKFVFDSYANRKGKGTSAALDRCTYYAASSKGAGVSGAAGYSVFRVSGFSYPSPVTALRDYSCP